MVPQQPSGIPSGPFYTPGGTYGAPVNPGPTYVPQNSPGSGGPTPIFSPTNPGATPTYDNSPGSGGNAPGFNETPQGGKVPDPSDDAGFERGTQRPQLTPTSSSNSSITEPEDETPFTQKETRRLPQASSYDPAASLTDTENEFEAPEVRQISSTESGDEDVQFAASSARVKPSPYGHDPEFTWVQGKVEFDKATKTWYITYDDHPPASDQLGGDLPLADHPMLARLRTGDMVRMEGAIDESEADARGKPVYQVSRFKKL